MSKKMLVRFDPDKPEKQSSDFLAPIPNEQGEVRLSSLKTGKESEFGLVVFTGRPISANDVFAKIVDSGHKTRSVNETLECLGAYVESLPSLSIGSVVTLERVNDVSRDFIFKKSDLKSGSSSQKRQP